MTTRRQMASMLAASVLAAAPIASAARQRNRAGPRPATYVLVHGAGGGGWCWKLVAPILRAAGHTVYAPSMTGAGERWHVLGPDTGLETHIADIAALLKWEDLTNVILVGHSYGGMVITGVADRARDRIGQLVYLDAAHPANGDSLADVAPATIAMGKQSLRRINGIEVIGSPQFEERNLAGMTSFPPLGTGTGALETWMAHRSTPVPWKAIVEKLVLNDEAAVRRIPRTSINTTQSMRGVGESAAATRRLQSDRVWTVDTSHNLMLTEPKIVGEMLLRLAGL